MKKYVIILILCYNSFLLAGVMPQKYPHFPKPVPHHNEALNTGYSYRDSTDTDRFLPPQNLTIHRNAADITITWDPVTQTVNGITGAPDCYIIYASVQCPPLSEYNFIDISLTTDYTHAGVAANPLNNFQFYYITAYSGPLSRLQEILNSKKSYTYRELQQALEQPK